MFVQTPLKSGNILVEEMKLCVVCKRMISKSNDQFVQVYLPSSKAMAYGHKNCPHPQEGVDYVNMQQ